MCKHEYVCSHAPPPCVMVRGQSADIGSLLPSTVWVLGIYAGLKAGEKVLLHAEIFFYLINFIIKKNLASK